MSLNHQHEAVQVRMIGKNNFHKSLTPKWIYNLIKFLKSLVSCADKLHMDGQSVSRPLLLCLIDE